MEVTDTAAANAHGPPAVDGDTCLPHWGALRRAIHARCRCSRMFNTIVAAVEMRLGRGELLSLPQYMSLCPTGQCNAQCVFCSVTQNRTGIAKKQLAFDKLDRFLAPVAGAIRMYGLEGNGEPLLYDRFDDLIRVLTARGARLYLITNGELLTPEQIDLLLAHGVDSINFSLNAATAETHQRVMKLKNFERVVANIKRLVANRKHPEVPMLSVSMVVTQENIHEVPRFVRFAECELGVNRVYIRALSEIANEQGAIEDTRELVPYESGVQEMLDDVRKYLADTPRKAEVVIRPEDFRNVRPDPLDRTSAPREFRLPSPQRWQVDSPDAQVAWKGTAINVRWKGKPGPYLVRSYSAACVPGSALSLPVKVNVRSGRLSVGVLSEDASQWVQQFAFDTGEHDRTLTVSPGTNRRVQVVLYALTDEQLDVEVDWLDTLDTGEGSAPAPANGARVPSRKPRWSSVASLAALRRRLFVGEVRIYCHKPFTDLHNFTVDGRMDVCCIATGASQQRYALGNLMTQEFQEVWNGERAREFRRTVNTDKRLPPCQRCPMAYQYHGPFFDPVHTLDRIRFRLSRALRWLPLSRLWVGLIYYPVSWVFRAVVFRGFKRGM